MTKLVPITPQSSSLTPDASAKSADPIGLQDLIGIFRRRLLVFAGVAGSVAALLALVQLSQPKVYTATASVMLDGRSRDVVKETEVVSGLPADSAAIDTEVKVVGSRNLAARVVERQGLMKDGEFNPEIAPKPQGLGAVFGQIGGAFRALTAKPEARGATPAAFVEKMKKEMVVSEVLSRLEVRRVGQTRLIEVSFTSRSPAKAAQLANAFVDQYLVSQLDTKFEATRRANAWLSERLAAMRAEVQTAEDAVEDYRNQAGLLTASGATLTERQISDLQTQLVTLRGDLAERDARLSRVKSQLARGDTSSLAEVLQSDTIVDLRRQEAELVRKLADMRENYGPEWPDLKRAESELAELRNEIDRQVRRVVSTFEQEANIARERVRTVEASLSGMRSELSGNNSSNVRLRELERNAEASRTLYEAFLTRFKETGQQEGMVQPDAQLVSLASVPIQPSAPNRNLALILSALAGIAIGVLVVVVLELLESSYRTSSDFENETGVRHLGLVPAIPPKRPAPFSMYDPDPMPENVLARGPVGRATWSIGRFLNRFTTFARDWVTAPSIAPAQQVVEKPLSSFAEALRTLRAAVLLSAPEPPKVVMLTSAVAGEGKTSTSFALARISAMSGSRVIVVDCDLRRKGLTEAAGVTPKAGLIEVLTGQADLASAILRDQRTNLDILGLSGAGVPNEDLFNSQTMRDLLARLSSSYDMVILDTAPVLLVAETRVLASAADAVLLIAHWRKTPKALVRAAISALKAAKAPLIGASLTRVDTQSVRLYADGEMGAYYKAYNKYYVE